MEDGFVANDADGTIVFQSWRPDKQPADCRYDQLEVTTAYEPAQVFGATGRRPV